MSTGVPSIASIGPTFHRPVLAPRSVFSIPPIVALRLILTAARRSIKSFMHKSKRITL